MLKFIAAMEVLLGCLGIFVTFSALGDAGPWGMGVLLLFFSLPYSVFFILGIGLFYRKRWAWWLNVVLLPICLAVISIVCFLLGFKFNTMTGIYILVPFVLGVSALVSLFLPNTKKLFDHEHPQKVSPIIVSSLVVIPLFFCILLPGIHIPKGLHIGIALAVIVVSAVATATLNRKVAKKTWKAIISFQFVGLTLFVISFFIQGLLQFSTSGASGFGIFVFRTGLLIGLGIIFFPFWAVEMFRKPIIKTSIC